MNEILLIAIAAAVAFFMATLLKAGISPDFRAAARTTLVVLLGWCLAGARFGFKSWSGLAWPVRWMLVLSLLASLVAWWLYFRGRRARAIAPASISDRVNVGFAVLFAALFLLQQSSVQSLLIGLCLVSGAMFFAFGSR